MTKGRPPKHRTQSKRNAQIWYVSLSVVYLIILLLSPVPHKTIEQYHITTLTVRLLDLSFGIPLIAIWGAAFYGYFKLSQYAGLVNRGDDSKALSKLSYGILLLALWLPVSSIVSGITKDFADAYHGFLTPDIIINNYVGLLFPLAGYILIGEGARNFSELVKVRPSRRAIYIMGFVVITVGVVYSHLVASTQNRLNAAYHLDTDMVLLTLVIPYIFTWFIGVLATYELYVYHSRVKGVLYSRAMSLLAYGIGSMIVISMFIQYLSTLASRLSVLSLSWILALIYLLLVMLALSFVLIAVGAKRLQRIEEV